MDNHSKVLLLDFYGKILTSKQYECMDLHYNEDLSFAEIAQQLSISRQGVFDLVKRSQELLQKMEIKLGFIEKFRSRILVAEKVLTVLNSFTSNKDDEYCLSNNVMVELKTMINSIIDGELEEE